MSKIVEGANQMLMAAESLQAEASKRTTTTKQFSDAMELLAMTSAVIGSVARRLSTLAVRGHIR